MQIGLFREYRTTHALLSFTLKGLLASLAGFSLFRILLAILNLNHLANMGTVSLLFQTFVRGLWNDLLACGVLFWLPLLLAATVPLVRKGKRTLLILGLGLTALAMQLCLTVSSLDVPFFQHFFARLSDMVLNWKDQPQFLIRMVAQETRFWWFIGLFLFLSFGIWWWVLRRIPHLMRTVSKREGQHQGTSISMVILLLLLSLFLRSKLVRKNFFAEKETATSFTPLLDKISQNPLLTLVYSLSEQPVRELLKERISMPETIARLRKIMNRSVDRDVLVPVASQEPIVQGMNVILVLMESVNSRRMHSGLMPRLQHIASKGTSWARFYSSGVHTYAGIYATLCGFPVQLRRHAMKWESDQSYCGLATQLQERGYRTMFYLTHNEVFDNMGAFLRKNGFSRLIGLDQYDKGLAVSTFGVPDHVQFDRVLSELDDQRGKSPFLAVLLSASNHAPYRLPEGIPFQPKSSGLPDQMLEYSDWALGRFMDSASGKDWYQRTLFLFVGDHGASGDFRFHLPYSMVHVPMIMSGPGIPAGQDNQDLGSQVDIAPTILGRLGGAYKNFGFGKDLFRERDEMAVFCSDDYLGCTDGEYFLSFNFDRPGILKRIDGSPLALSKTAENRHIREMKSNALSFWRMADWLIGEKKLCGAFSR